MERGPRVLRTRSCIFTRKRSGRAEWRRNAGRRWSPTCSSCTRRYASEMRTKRNAEEKARRPPSHSDHIQRAPLSALCSAGPGGGVAGWTVYFLTPRAGNVLCTPAYAGFNSLGHLRNEAHNWASSVTEWRRKTRRRCVLLPPGGKSIWIS
jgi:hypothetical protein